MLWGIMTAPMMPMACSSSFRPQPGQLGRKMPFSTSTCPGRTTTYWEAVRRGTVSCHPPTTGWYQWGHHVGSRQHCRKKVVPSSPLHLIAKGQDHDGDEEAKESLQFAEP